MQTDFLWNELLGILHQLEIEIRWEAGEFGGGLYSCRGVRRFLLNQGSPREWQINIICRDLSRLDLSQLYISPAVRGYIEGSNERDPSDPAVSGLFRRRAGHETRPDQ